MQGVVGGRVELCCWDAAKKQCVTESYSADDAALVIAARLAADAYQLDREDPEVRRLYLATKLEAAAYEIGLDRPLPEGEGSAVAEAGRSASPGSAAAPGGRPSATRMATAAKT